MYRSRTGDSAIYLSTSTSVYLSIYIHIYELVAIMQFIRNVFSSSKNTKQITIGKYTVKVKKQIVERGRSYEQDMPAGYLERVWSGYEEHYKYHRGSRVLWIDTSDLDFVKSIEDFEKLLTCILAPRKPGVDSVKP